jgi:CheY-like chemotaxis protein
VEIQQVLVNFIRNSFEAMARPAIAVRRLTIRTEVIKSNVRVSITDTGGGLVVTNPAPPVFIVDDEEPVRSGLARLLRAIGMPSRTFESAEAFLENYTASQTGCLLVDIRMPGMSGLDLIEELERRQTALPAIVMTGHADASTMQRLKTVRTLGCLEKPFSVDQLKALLGRWWATLDRGDPPWPPPRPAS